MSLKEPAIHLGNFSHPLPRDWMLFTLDDCCNVLDSKRIPLNSQERSKMIGDVPYYGANGIQGYINNYIFDQDLVLLAEDGGYFNEYQHRPIAYYVKGKSWVNNHAHVLSNKPGFNLKWIYYSLVHKNILHWIRGTTRSKLNQAEMKKIIVPIPPLLEQQKIITILSTLDELIHKINQVIEQTKRLKKGTIQRLLSKGVRHARFKKTSIGEIPEEWELTLSGNLFSFVTSGSRDWAKYYSENGPIMIRITNLDHETIYPDFSNAQRVMLPTGVEGVRTRVKSDDILISITADVGMVAVVPDPAPEAYVNQHIALARPIDGCNSKYIARYLSWCEGGLKQFTQIQRGVTKFGLSLDDIKSIWVPLPTKTEQQTIASILDSIELSISTDYQYKYALQCLRKGIIQNLVTGRLRVEI